MKLTDPALIEEYTAFATGHDRSHLLQSVEWGRVKSAWSNEFVIVRDGEGKIKATLSILLRKVPMLPFYFMYAPRGPICDLHDREALRALTDGAKEIAKKYGAITLKIDTDTKSDDSEYEAIMKELGYTLNNSYSNLEGVQARYVMRVDLQGKTEEQLLETCYHKTRYNIRLAQKKGVRVVEGKREDIPLFFQLMQETGRRDGFVIRELDYFYKLYDCLGQEYFRLFLAYVGEECVAGTIAGVYGNKCLYLYGASGNQYRNYMPTYLLQWEMMRFSLQRGCTIYDLRGVPGMVDDENNPIYGLYRFKKGFGGEVWELIGEFDLVCKPFWFWAITTAEKLRKTLRKKLSQLRKGK